MLVLAIKYSPPLHLLVGVGVGLNVGRVGALVGRNDGTGLVGRREGLNVGFREGFKVGFGEGLNVGLGVLGLLVGCPDGCDDG